MRHLKCSSCGSEIPAGEMFHVEGAAVCQPCADRLVKDARAKKRTLPVGRIIDPTICARCKTNYGNTDLPLIGGTPICNNCAPALYAHPFPGWLKASLAVLLVLLAVALARGAPYFRAGQQLVLGRRAMDRGDYHVASAHFASVLPVAPTDQDVVLLGAKAYLLAGDVAGAQPFLQLRSTYQKDELFNEVNTLWERANDAFKKAEEAAKLTNAHRNADAARLMNQAAREYPQSVPLAVGALLLNGYVAFDRKDYDALLQINRQALAMLLDTPRLMGGVASALACKYAVTGDTVFRTEAEQLLAQAELLAARSPEEKAALEEYAERIRHRLRTRVIIDKDEYDRRFRRKPA